MMFSDQTRTIVTLQIFSGRRDPVWPLDRRDASEFERMYAALGEAAPATERFEAFAGYDGFIVDRPGQPSVVVFSGLAYEPTTRRMRIDANRDLEQWLFTRLPVRVTARLGTPSFAALSQRLDERFSIRGIEGDGEVGGLNCDVAPEYPGPSGVWSTGQRENNCYNYANDEPSQHGMSALPGGTDAALETEADIANALAHDRLILQGKQLPVACPIESDAHYMAICLRFHPLGSVMDFHCYRMDRNGRWSHKDGKKKVRELDDAGQLISDLRAATWKMDMLLVGFFLSIDNHRRIRAPEDP